MAAGSSHHPSEMCLIRALVRGITVFGLLLPCSVAGLDDRWSAYSQHGITHGEAPKSSDRLVVMLAIRQRNLRLLENMARSVSDPLQHNYGEYYSRDEMNGFISPSEEDVKHVREHFEQLPDSSVEFSLGRDLARFTCSVLCVEKTFNTTLLIQKGRVAPGDTPIRSVAPIRLPWLVAQALDGVSLNAPLFMPPRPRQASRPAFVYQSSGRKAPRIRPFVVAGDRFVSMFFVAFCKDELVNTDTLEKGLCTSRPGPSIIAFDFLILQAPNSQKVVHMPADSDVLGQSAADCGKQSGCVQFNATVGDVMNFASTTIRVRAMFSDGSVSVFSDSAEVEAAWPMTYSDPRTLAKFYDIPIEKPLRHPKSTIAVAEFLGQYYNPQDLENFFKMMGVRSWDTSAKLRLVGRNEPMAGSVLGGEAQLDIQYITAMAANVSTFFWSVPSIELSTRQEPFLDWLMQLADTDDEAMPLVHSVSYGDDAPNMPSWFKQRVNVEFMKLAARGVTILVASGDDGAHGSLVATKGTEFCHHAREEFPASSPWVTAVGGTQFATATSPVCQYYASDVIVQCGEAGEVACSSAAGSVITTGGGFSSDFPRPWYQVDHVDKYLKQTDAPVPSAHKLGFNASGRAYPDVAAVASGYPVLMGEHLEVMSGTSAATPLIASMVARWNEERLQKGMPRLGFLNPLLYRLSTENPEAFNDVLMGDNRCSRSTCCSHGYSAARGWDAVSGIGSPRFSKVAELVSKESGLASTNNIRPRETQLTGESSPRWGDWGIFSGVLLLSLPTFMLVAFVAKKFWCRSVSAQSLKTAFLLDR